MSEIQINRISEITENYQDEIRFLAQAAYVAYPVYDKNSKITSPTLEEFDFKKWLYGATPLSQDVHNEPFVAVFQSKTNTNEWLLAFKGSATIWDWWEDFKFDFADFPFFNNNKKKSNLQTEQGFKDIYTTVVSSQIGSLQHQLFDFVNNDNPRQLIIAGHSLGSALAEMFTYDLLKCGGDLIPKQISHINYACPKVFNYYSALDFRSLLNANFTVLRIVNQHDLVPKLPEIGEEQISFCYYHATDYFLMDFWEKYESLPDHFYVYHSIVNYKNVLNTINMTLPISYPQKGECRGIKSVTEHTILEYDIPS